MLESLVVILAITIIGYQAQRTGICLVRGVNDLRQRKPAMLIAILLSGMWVWVYMLIAGESNLSYPFVRHELAAVFVFGGLIFGIGAGMNQGCSVSTMSKLARGDLSMLATISGWAIGWGLLTRIQPAWESSVLQPSSTVTVLSSLLVCIIVTLVVVFRFSQHRKLWFGVMVIGLLSGVLFLFQPNWTPSTLLQDLTAAAADSNAALWPNGERYLLIAALLIGMTVAAIRNKSFRWQWLKGSGMAFHLFAGTLMGIGSSMAMGGNDAQILLALPALSPAGLVVILSMLLGIFLMSLVNKERRS